jgi:hypothetical protein
MVVTARAQLRERSHASVGCTLSTPCRNCAPWLPPVAIAAALTCARGFPPFVVQFAWGHQIVVALRRSVVSKGKGERGRGGRSSQLYRPERVRSRMVKF